MKCGDVVKVHDTAASLPHPVTVVMANILAGTLVELAPQLCGYLQPGGQLILAGILKQQVHEVRAGFAPLDGSQGVCRARRLERAQRPPGAPRMSRMFTTCPACRLNLAVTPTDLRIGQGYVRCGRCERVFNALLSLSEDLDQEQQSGLTATGTTTVPALEVASEEPAAEAATAADDDRRRRRCELGPDHHHQLSGPHAVDVVESQATGTFETIVLEGDGYLQTEEHVDELEVDAAAAGAGAADGLAPGGRRSPARRCAGRRTSE